MSKKLHSGAGANLFTLARQNRKNPTDAENILWDKLRGRKLKGIKFRRQHPIGHYIADFYCAKQSLVIEVDGAIHMNQQEYDEERDQILRSLSISVLRFTNEQVIHDLGAVLSTIESHLPHPRPSS